MVIALLVLVLVVLGINVGKNYLASAAGGDEPVGVKAEPADKSAKISWTTEKATLSRVQYGTSPASMLLQSDLSEETVPKTAHQVSISNLKPGQAYYFRIKTGDNLYDNGGIPFSFKTKGGADSVAPTSVVTPTVALLPTSTPVPTITTTDLGANISSCTSGIDYNKDGSVNVLDIVYCNTNNKSSSGSGVAPTSAAAVTLVPTVKPSTVTCSSGVDYNKDGATNVLDIVYCNTNK